MNTIETLKASIQTCQAQGATKLAAYLERQIAEQAIRTDETLAFEAINRVRRALAGDKAIERHIIGRLSDDEQ